VARVTSELSLVRDCCSVQSSTIIDELSIMDDRYCWFETDGHDESIGFLMSLM
jgi:hypothetical protein